MLGAGITVATFIPELTDGGLGTPNEVGETDPVALSVLGVAVMVISLALASVCLATTVIALRPAGMKLHHVPLFAWSMLIAASAWLLAFGVLVLPASLLQRSDQDELRWVLAHMIEETARHAGHADIARELIDDTTGYFPDN